MWVGGTAPNDWEASMKRACPYIAIAVSVIVLIILAVVAGIGLSSISESVRSLKRDIQRVEAKVDGIESKVKTDYATLTAKYERSVDKLETGFASTLNGMNIAFSADIALVAADRKAMREAFNTGIEQLSTQLREIDRRLAALEKKKEERGRD